MRKIKIDNNDNKNTYTLITGATGGLGKAFCIELAKLNHNLYLTGTNETKLTNLKDEILQLYPNINVKYMPCDLANFESRTGLLKDIKENNVVIRTLINNAGFITEGSIKNAQIETILKCIQVNCEGTIHLTKQILDNKPINHKLNIICITSMAANYPMPYMAIYSSTKSLLKNFMIALRHEYKQDNVNVLIVEPGAIATSEEMKTAIETQGLKGKLSSVSPEKIAKKSIKYSVKKRSRYVPGVFNRLTLFVSNLAPSNLKTKAIAKMWRKSQDKRNIK